MSSLGYTSILIARATEGAPLGSHYYRLTTQFHWIDLVPIIVGAALIALAWQIFNKVRNYRDFKQPCNDPAKLFRELCQVHALDRSAQGVLRRLAQVYRLAQPAEVFVTPQIFDPERLPASLREDAARIRELRKLLF